jgi:hypothetical protein
MSSLPPHDPNAPFVAPTIEDSVEIPNDMVGTQDPDEAFAGYLSRSKKKRKFRLPGDDVTGLNLRGDGHDDHPPRVPARATPPSPTSSRSTTRCVRRRPPWRADGSGDHDDRHERGHPVDEARRGRGGRNTTGTGQRLHARVRALSKSRPLESSVLGGRSTASSTSWREDAVRAIRGALPPGRRS